MNRQRSRWETTGFWTRPFDLVASYWNPRNHSNYRKEFHQLNWRGFRLGERYYYNDWGDDWGDEGSFDDFGESDDEFGAVESEEEELSAPEESSFMAGGSGSGESGEFDEGAAGDGFDDMELGSFSFTSDQDRSLNNQKEKEDLGDVKVRTNLSETAFFFPELTTNEKGEVSFKFTMPEALTRWKFMALAHTQDLKIGHLTDEVVTQKELMVVPNIPRFLREGDKMTFAAKITNMTDKPMTGTAELRLLDAFTMDPIPTSFKLKNGQKSFNAPAGQSTSLEWNIEVPSTVQAVVTQVVAKSGNFSDGEENMLPILSNRMLVLETMPMPIRGKQSKDFRFEKLINANKSSTLKHEKLTLEFTSNPAWYAVQSLPYLMEYPHECSEQLFSRFYANALATHVANSNPKIKQVFDQWRQGSNGSKDALLASLESNPDLKGILLEETPWVLSARSDAQRKERIGLLFDLNTMASELADAREKLRDRQDETGGFAWYPGMKSSRYITQLVTTGMGHLRKLGVSVGVGDPEVNGMTTSAIKYLDKELQDDLDYLKRHNTSKESLESDHLSYVSIQYLYMRSFYQEVAQTSGTQEAFDYYYDQAKKYWMKKSDYMQGMLALTFHRNGDSDIAMDIIKGLKENAVLDDEMGMYWKYNSGWYWYEAPIETQALLIEAFNDVANDQESVDAMKVWLLKQKQTQDWETTRATVAACNALLLTGANWLENDQLVEVTVGKEKVNPMTNPDIQVEAGTGYYTTSWNRQEITPEMGKVTVTKNDEGVAWGAMYWQYFEQLDKITFAQTPISIKKELHLEKMEAKGPVLTPITGGTVLTPGDKVMVRIEIRVDRDMEYVHMKDMRAAGFEPVNVLSQYKWQGNIGYYESTQDAATNFFMDYLPKGTHVFEYPLRVTNKGNFSNGITTIQCMYAPEFTSHSEGIRVTVK